MKRKDLRQIRRILKKGDPLYYNWFSQIGVVVTNEWDKIREYNHLGNFPGWKDFALIHDLDFEYLDRLLKLEEEREVEIYVELH